MISFPVKIHIVMYVILVSIYMPCDNLNVSQCRDDYVDVFNGLETMLNMFNDPSRRSAQSDIVHDFWLNNVLELWWDRPLSKRDCTYGDHESHHRSCINHFVMSPMIFQCTKVCCVIESPLNPSDYNLSSFRFDWAFDIISFTDKHYDDKKIA